MGHNVLRQETDDAAVETSFPAGLEKAWSERLMYRVRNVLFLQACSATGKTFLLCSTSAIRVQNRRHVFRYNVNEPYVNRVNIVKKVIEKF